MLLSVEVTPPNTDVFDLRSSMSKPNHKVKKANHGKRPANNKRRKARRKKIKT